MLYFDGASNTLRHGICVVLISPRGKYCPFTVRLDFDYTNNVTEYKACILGLQAAMDKKVKNLKVWRLSPSHLPVMGRLANSRFQIDFLP